MSGPVRHTIARLTGAAAGVALLAAPVGAQALLEPTVRVGPQFVEYRLGGDLDTRISELAIPVAVVLPMGSRLNLDIATAYASSRVEQNGVEETITGVTDTQLRANYTLGSDFIVLTAGLNLPTGQSKVKGDQLKAAGYIGNDFLAFPVSNLGTGFAATAGVAVARPLGEWNVGFGASMRRAAAYDAFEIGEDRVRFEPGDEYRARLGVDRAVGPGRVAFGLTYSAFGDDKDAQSSYATGDRIVTQAAYSAPVGGMSLFVSGWNLMRLEGERAGQETMPGENITNLAVTAGIGALGTTLEPSIELRHWLADGERAGTLGQFGMRVRVPLGPLTAYPGASFTTGSYVFQAPPPADAPEPPAQSYSLTGWRAMVTLRYGL